MAIHDQGHRTYGSPTEVIAPSTEMEVMMVSYRMREMNNQMSPLQPLLNCDTAVSLQPSSALLLSRAQADSVASLCVKCSGHFFEV